MTKKHSGQSWMPPEDYGRALPFFSVNLLVADISKSVAFYMSVLGANLVIPIPISEVPKATIQEAR